MDWRLSEADNPFQQRIDKGDYDSPEYAYELLMCANSFRKGADAASEKAYAAGVAEGRRQMGGEIVAWLKAQRKYKHGWTEDNELWTETVTTDDLIGSLEAWLASQEGK